MNKVGEKFLEALRKLVDGKCFLCREEVDKEEEVWYEGKLFHKDCLSQYVGGDR